jgi:hypothetical protein
VTWIKLNLLLQKKSVKTAGSDLETGGESYSSSFDFLGPPNLQLNVSSGKSSKEKKTVELFIAAIVAVVLQFSLLVIAAVTVYHEPTKQKIKYEPEPYGLPCYVVGSVLLFIGMAICSCAIESSTSEFMWKRRRDDGETGDADNDGGRSHKTRRKKHKKRMSEEKYPRLIWLQQFQRVNDQAFDSFVILGGSKRYVVTSSRQEDVQLAEQLSNEKSKRDANRVDSLTPSESNMLESVYTLKHEKLLADSKVEEAQKSSRMGWGVLTMVGVVSGGLGFIAQFMGLRGLPWPCSVSQLVAIFSMALTRALVRRRLGKIPLFCPALSMYELDFLAARLVFNDHFREFDDVKKHHNGYLRHVEPRNICIWKVATPGPDASERFTLPVASTATQTTNASTDMTAIPVDTEPANDLELAASNKSNSKSGAVTTTAIVNAEHHKDGGSKILNTSVSGIDRQSSTWLPALPSRISSHRAKKAEVDHGFREGSSQQLVRVRERLGNLCKWNNSASAAALALAQSIEQFMASFFPDSETAPITWVIKTTKIFDKGISRETDNVVINLTKSKRKKWLVEVGKVEAILSLWLASIEAETLKNAEQATSNADAPGKAQRRDELADWRRTQAGIGSKLECYRVIGDNYKDNVLKRDISWWVGERFCNLVEWEDVDPGTLPPRGGDKKLVIGFNGPSEG